MSKEKNIERSLRVEKEAILEFIQLGRGSTERKQELAAELGISLSALKYKVAKFKDGGGVGRKTRSDKNIPKKDVEAKTKREFFAELAFGTSIDEATRKLGLTEHQGNQLSKEYARTDKWQAIRNAPQLEDLKETIKDLFRIDIAIVDAELNGVFAVQLKDAVINVPVEELRDIQTILAHCLQRDKMAAIDGSYKDISKDDLLNARISYLKEELLEKKNVTEFTRLHRAVKPAQPDKQLDLQLVYAIIKSYEPGIDEPGIIKKIKDTYNKLKTQDAKI